MTTAKAAVMEAPGHIAVRRFPVPDPGPGAIVLSVQMSGICGTDKHTFRGEVLQYGGTPHERQLAYPLICGHENVGRVAALGGEVLDHSGRPLRVGDRVVPAANVTCGRCWYCKNRQPYYMCENLHDYGNSLNCVQPPHLFGGWAEYMYILPGTPLFRVPEELPDNVAVLAEPMAVTHGFDRARRLNESFGERVVVFGLGPLGLCHLIKARLMGAGQLIAIDRLASRLAVGADFGASVLLDADALEPDELVARVYKATEGRGADVVLVCTGVANTFPVALRMVRVGGVVVEAGAFVDMGPVHINPNADICTKSVSVLGIGGETAESYAPSMDLLARNLDTIPLERIVTHCLPLEAAQAAVELAQTAEAMKVVLSPSAETPLVG